MPRRLVFVTGNRGKYDEAQAHLTPLGYEVEMRDEKPREIQADGLADVARFKLHEVASRIGRACFLDDAGLFVDHLRGFPGVYSAYALKTLGIDGILKLMEDAPDRSAEFRCVIALWQPGEGAHFFEGVSRGTLAQAPRSTGHGFGFDPIFIPEGHTETFAELSLDVKNRISHRGRALDALARHLAASAHARA